jgi:hypothetical protein
MTKNCEATKTEFSIMPEVSMGRRNTKLELSHPIGFLEGSSEGAGRVVPADVRDRDDEVGAGGTASSKICE